MTSEKPKVMVNLEILNPKTLEILKEWRVVDGSNNFLIEEDSEFYTLLKNLEERSAHINFEEEGDLEIINNQLDLLCRHYWRQQIAKLPKSVLLELARLNYIKLDSKFNRANPKEEPLKEKDNSLRATATQRMFKLLDNKRAVSEFPAVKEYEVSTNLIDSISFSQKNLPLIRELVILLQDQIDKSTEAKEEILIDYVSSFEKKKEEYHKSLINSYIYSIDESYREHFILLSAPEQLYFALNKIKIILKDSDVRNLRILLIQNLTKDILLNNEFSLGSGQTLVSFIKSKLVELGFKPNATLSSESLDDYSDIVIEKALDSLMFQDSTDPVIEDFINRENSHTVLVLTDDLIRLLTYREPDLESEEFKERLFRQLGNRKIKFESEEVGPFLNKQDLNQYILKLVNQIESAA